MSSQSSSDIPLSIDYISYGDQISIWKYLDGINPNSLIWFKLKPEEKTKEKFAELFGDKYSKLINANPNKPCYDCGVLRNKLVKGIFCKACETCYCEEHLSTHECNAQIPKKYKILRPYYILQAIHSNDSELNKPFEEKLAADEKAFVLKYKCEYAIDLHEDKNLWADNYYTMSHEFVKKLIEEFIYWNDKLGDKFNMFDYQWDVNINLNLDTLKKVADHNFHTENMPYEVKGSDFLLHCILSHQVDKMAGWFKHCLLETFAHSPVLPDHNWIPKTNTDDKSKQ